MMAINDDGLWDDAIDAWVRYFSADVEWFADALVPADEADVRRLEMRAGSRFPAELRAFLRRMGRTPPGTLGRFMAHISYGVDAVAEYYAEPTSPTPPGAVYLWTLDGWCELYLDTTQGLPYPVVSYEWGFDDEGVKISGTHHACIYFDCRSLLQFLYHDAFRFLRVDALPHRSVLRSSEAPANRSFAARTARVRDIATKLGFSPVPHVPGELAYFNRKDAALMFYPSKAKDDIHVAAASEREVGGLREILADNLDMDVLDDA
jgi:hypothetical protein